MLDNLIGKWAKNLMMSAYKDTQIVNTFNIIHHSSLGNQIKTTIRCPYMYSNDQNRRDDDKCF